MVGEREIDAPRQNPCLAWSLSYVSTLEEGERVQPSVALAATSLSQTSIPRGNACVPPGLTMMSNWYRDFDGLSRLEQRAIRAGHAVK